MKHRSRWGWVCVWVVTACGTPAVEHQGGGGSASGDAVDETGERRESHSETQSHSEADPDACAQTGPRACGEGCWPDARGFCQPIVVSADPCSRIDPPMVDLGRGPEPDFRAPDDPCERVDAGCVLDLRTHRCVRFERVSECPAETAPCQHSAQRDHACQDRRQQCECRGPAPYCGGAAPPPWLSNQPWTWQCLPEVDERGCPRAIQEGTRCRTDGLECIQGCVDSYRCEGRRWRRRVLPPRP